MNLPKLVLMSKSVHRGSTITSAQEPKEWDAYIYGEIEDGTARVFSYNVRLATERTYTTVYETNDTSVKRINQAGNIWLRSAECLGGLHRHVKGRGDSRKENDLSETDIETSLRKIEEFNRPFWIEILVNVEEANFEMQREIGERIKVEGNKLDFIAYDSPYHGYRGKFSAFIVTPDAKKHRVPIRDEKIKVIRQGHYNGIYYF